MGLSLRTMGKISPMCFRQICVVKFQIFDTGYSKIYAREFYLRNYVKEKTYNATYPQKIKQKIT